MYVYLDNLLNLIYPIDTASIPKYLWNNDTSNIIPKTKALEIAESCFEDKGISETLIYLIDDNQGKYYWEIRRLMECNYCEEESYKKNELSDILITPYSFEKVVMIDCVSGEIVKCEVKKEEGINAFSRFEGYRNYYDKLSRKIYFDID